jgi:hypothetical protein
VAIFALLVSPALAAKAKAAEGGQQVQGDVEHQARAVRDLELGGTVGLEITA